MSGPTVVIIPLTPDELRALVRDEARAVLAEHVPSAAPSALVDRHELARLLDVSPATVTRLTNEGAPVTHVGQSPRYEVAVFRSWLAERGRLATKGAPAKRATIAGVRLLSRGRP